MRAEKFWTVGVSIRKGGVVAAIRRGLDGAGAVAKLSIDVTEEAEDVDSALLTDIAEGRGRGRASRTGGAES